MNLVKITYKCSVCKCIYSGISCKVTIPYYFDYSYDTAVFRMPTTCMLGYQPAMAISKWVETKRKEVKKNV